MVNIKRINELAKKSREEGLTEEEKLEQAKLRRQYIDSVKASLEHQLDNTYVVDKFGVKQKIKPTKKQ